MKLRITIDAETAARLAERAVKDRRPVAMQAEVVLREALGLNGRQEEPNRAVAAKEASGA